MSVDILDYEIVGNELWRFGAVFCILLVSFIIGRIVSYVMAYGAEQREEAGEEIPLAKLILRSASKPTVFLIFAGGFEVAMLFLTMSDPVRQATNLIGRLLVSLGIAYFLYRLIDVVEHYLSQYARKAESKLDETLVPIFRKTFRVFIVIIAALYIAESLLGKPLSTILAGLGIGGLALALAAQESIKELFGSVMILIDRPYSIGDRVVVEGHDGPVEEIGFRSTRIRALTGNLVTIPNDKMASASIENLGRRPHIMRQFNVGITYDTLADKMERAIKIIEKILENHEGMQPGFPPRVFFDEFKDSSLNIMVTYWYYPPDLWSSLAFGQKVNLQIMHAFEKEGIEFAFPTQTVFLANDDRRQLAVRLLGKDLEQPE